ncbi:MAG: glycosyltransferase family 39 protein [Pseudomonadota bacterium]
MSATRPDRDARADPGARAGVVGSSGAWIKRVAFHPATWMVVLAFQWRLLWVLLVPSRPVGDFALYRESAAYLLEHGRLDPEFIYMPGYVFLLAGVEALGGGLLAAKMIGVLAGTATVAAVAGIADVLFGRRAGIVAAAAAAIWPAGIAVASVTGTDVPAGALVAVGVCALVRLGPRRPRLAAVVSGLVLGLGAFVRAVAAPLAALSVLYWLATGAPWRTAVRRTAVSLAIAFAVLLPWGLRNRAVYGEFFFTDSHGGTTALVGANPNSEGTYSRSLNLMFVKATGYRALETTPRHRASDRAAYALAKRWTAFEPAYALGLVVAKADRLLTHERNLLYWPVFRQGVLTEQQRAFFDAHRRALENLADGFWWVAVALSVAGIALSGMRRDWNALAVLAFPAVLGGIYTLFFSEVRYHLAIAPFLFPFAALTIDWAWWAAPRRFRGEHRTLVTAVAAIAVVFLGWAALLAFGESVRANHRWAVSLCSYPDAPGTTLLHLCEWRRAAPAAGASPVRGVWNGFGLRVGGPFGAEVLASARATLPLPAGRYRVRAGVSVAEVRPGAAGAGAVSVALRARDRVVARVLSPPGGPPQAHDSGVDPGNIAGTPAAIPTAPEGITVPIAGIVEHTGGGLVLEFDIEGGVDRAIVDGATVWISNLIVERF